MSAAAESIINRQLNSHSERTAFKQRTAELDELAANGGMYCGMPVAMLVFQDELADRIRFSRSYVESLVESGVLTLKPEDQEPVITEAEVEGNEQWALHAEWYTKQPWRGQYGIVHVWRNKQTGRFEKTFQPMAPWVTRLELIGKTTATLLSFGIEEAEIKARQKLESMLKPAQRRTLLLCDSFYELGKSGILYWIRKNRPTIAMRLDRNSEEDGQGTPLCALCLHPLGWYTNSFAGIMTPSDDMLAHLLMIRGNEHYFWRKANQHPLDKAVAGI